MDETLTLIRMRIGLDAARTFWEQTSQSPRLRWERIDTRRVQAAIEWFFRRTDKTFSFTDCTSFVVMRELHLKQALTCDRHFRDAGFEILP
jgi:predicted nucleic acid-binding protein